MVLQLKKAVKENCFLRLLVAGLPGTGKTYSSLDIGTNLVPGGVTLLLDSEYGSASKYADLFDFYTEQITNHDPRNYIKMIKEAEKAGVDVLILDSITHAWNALLGIVSEERTKSRDPFGGWQKGSPIHQEFVETILAVKCHVIATARTKSDYVIEPDRNGKMSPKKVGMKPVTQENTEYEFDIAGEIDSDHCMRVTKSRCPLVDKKTFFNPGKEFADIVSGWLKSGVKPLELKAEPPVVPEQKKPAFTQDTLGSNATVPPAAGVTENTAVKSVPQNANTVESSQPVVAAVQAGETKKPVAASPVQEQPASSTTQEQPVSVPNPKPADTQPVSSAPSAGAASVPTQQAAGTTDSVGPAEIKQLAEAAMANGWNKAQISEFICVRYNFGAANQVFTHKQWDEAVRLVSSPKNPNGVVTFDVNGVLLPVEHRF